MATMTHTSSSTARLLLLTFHYVSSVLAAYNPGNPPRTENFDPAEADPLGNITCVGDSYAINLPSFGNFNPNSVTMQRLCAKPQYHGGLPGQHVGGFCASYYSNRAHKFGVHFDQSPGAQVRTELANPRILLGCLLRCSCDAAHGLDPGLPDYQKHSITTYETKIDIVDDFDVPVTQHNGQLDHKWVDAMVIRMKPQIGGAMPTPIFVSMDENNGISCRGNLPSFPLPRPIFAANFRSLQEMCVVHHFGGNM